MANTSVIVIPEGKICDYVDGKFRNDTPEEYVRQTIEKRLVNEHKYLPKQIRIEYTLQLGSRKPRADIVIFDKDCGEQTQENIKIITECKKEAVEARNAKDGVEQLKSYMSACPNCEWGMWTNGRQKEVYHKYVNDKGQIDFIKNGLYPAVDLIGPNSPVKKAHYGGRLKRNYVEKNEETTVGFIGSSEMLDVSPQPVKFMIDDDRVSELHVKRGTVLISRSGTIGNMSFVNETLEKFLISEHAMRLECNNFPGYVYAYLKTKTGQALIRSNIYGSVIQQIEPEHLASIPIPNAPNEIKAKIDSMIVESYALRDESNHLINEATNLLIDELQLPAINEFDVDYFKKDAPVKTFSVKLSDMDYRLDASYHVPIVDAIIDHLNKHAEEVITVDDNRISKNIILPGRFKRVYVGEGEGRVFIGGKQLHELDPSNKKYLSLSQHGERIEKQLELHENMTLITCSGTIGKVALVGRHWEKWAANQHIIRIVPASENIAGYLNIFLASEYGYHLITRYTYGAVIDEIDATHVSNIPIPLLKNHDIQKRINDLALEANQKRYEAYKLEQKALEIMDREVIYAK